MADLELLEQDRVEEEGEKLKRVKILYVSQATGGVKRHIELLVSGLDRNRFEIVGAFPSIDHVRGSSPNKETFLLLFKRFGIRAIPFEMDRALNPYRDLKSFIRLLKILKQEQVDILHTHSSKAGFLGRLAGRLMRVPVIVHTPNAFAFDRPGGGVFSNTLYRFLERLAGYFCDALIAVSPSEEELAKKVVSPEKITQISNGIDVKAFDMVLDTEAKKRELGIPEGCPFILTVGRLASQKAPFDLLKAVEEVLRTRPESRFAYLGDGPLIEEAKAMIRDRHLERQIFLFDWREDVKQIVACCDIFVLPSLWEGLPYSLLEAMALSKPVVATAARGNRDVVLDGETGFLVPLRSPEHLADAVLRLLGDPALVKKMGQAGRRHVETHFQLKPHIEKTVTLYMRLLQDKGVRVD